MDARAMPMTTKRADSTSTRSGAIDASAQPKATMASAAGAQAVTRGRVVSGTVSATRAAQAWTGMTPKRMATARAMAR